MPNSLCTQACVCASEWQKQIWPKFYANLVPHVVIISKIESEVSSGFKMAIKKAGCMLYSKKKK